MNICAYENIFSGMKEYNDSLAENYGNAVVSTPPKSPTFPLTVFDEIRNVANRDYNGCFERLSSLGYRVDIFAKNQKNKTKQEIARELAKKFDIYMTDYVGLLRVSFNVNDNENDGSTYHIIMTYEGIFHENRMNFI
jgi:hypothetical protein